MKNHEGITEQEFLSQYDVSRYERPSIASDVVVFSVMDAPEDNYRRLPEKQLHVLLIRRGQHPHMGDWALPGGFVRCGETVEQAASRELKDETGLDSVYLEQLYTFSDPKRDPRAWIISCAHMALIDATRLTVTAGDDADRALWFRLDCKCLSEKTVIGADCCDITRRYEMTLRGEHETLTGTVESNISYTKRGVLREYTVIENGSLAFDHLRILACAMDRLRGKLEYTGIALHLMPTYFTLTELQRVYEVILGKPLLTAAFRRKIEPLVRGTEQYTGSAGHRPSRLFERNWNGIAGLLSEV